MDVVKADVIDNNSLDKALHGIDIAYYLIYPIHHMVFNGLIRKIPENSQ